MSLKEAIKQFCTHVSPWVLLAICASCWMFRLLQPAPFTPVEAAIGLGVMVYWPFQEWWMHRWLLHLGAVQILGKRFEPDFARTHRLHHEKPDDLKWVFLPVPHILTSLVAFTGVGYALTSSWSMTAVFMGCASLSTLMYEWTHYLTHTQYRPRGSYYRKIWRLHRWHHFKHEGYWFSFTVPYLDGWFGTGPDAKSVERSPTARTLGGEP